MAREKTEQQIDLYSRYGSPLQWVGAAIVGTVSSLVTFVSTTRTKFHDDSSFRQGTKVIHAVKALDLEKATDDQIGATMKHYTKAFKGNADFKAFTDARDAVNALEKKRTPNHLSGYADKKRAYQSTLKTWIDKNADKIEEVQQTPAFKEDVSKFLSKLKTIKTEANQMTDKLDETLLGIRSVGMRGHTVGAWQRLKNFGDYSSRNVLLKMGAAFAVAGGATLMAFNQLNTRDKLNEIDKQSERAERTIDAISEKVGIEAHEVKSRREHREELKLAAKGELPRSRSRADDDITPAAHILAEGRRHDGVQRDAIHEASLS